MKKKVLSILLLATILLPLPAYAAGSSVDVFDDVCQRANGVSSSNPSACQDKNLGGGNPIYGPDGIIIKVFNILSVIVGIAAVISIISAGTKFVTSGSNPEEVNKAREYIQYAVIGLAVAAAAQLLIRLVLLKISL